MKKNLKCICYRKNLRCQINSLSNVYLICYSIRKLISSNAPSVNNHMFDANDLEEPILAGRDIVGGTRGGVTTRPTWATTR